MLKYNWSKKIGEGIVELYKYGRIYIYIYIYTYSYIHTGIRIYMYIYAKINYNTSDIIHTYTLHRRYIREYILLYIFSDNIYI